MQKHRSLVAILLVTLVLAGCAKPVPETASAKPQAMVTVRVLSPYPDRLLDELITAFQRSHDGVRVEKVTAADPDFSTVAAMIRDRQIDVVPAAYMVDYLLRERLLLPLEPYARRENPAFFEQMKDYTRTGAVYDIPYTVTPYLLLYHPAYLAEAGLTIPPEGWTWAEFREAAARLTVHDGDQRRWGFTPSSQVLIGAWLEQRAEGDGWLVNDQAMAEALGFFAAMAYDDRSMPQDPADPSQIGLPGFYDGRGAMTLLPLESALALNAMLNLPFDVGMAPMPMISATKRAAVMSSRTMAIASTTQVPDAGWQFLRFAAGEEGAKVAVRSGAFPTYRSDSVRELWQEVQATQRPELIALYDLPWQVVPPQSTSDGLLWRVHKAFMQMMSGEVLPEQALADYRSAVRELR